MVANERAYRWLGFGSWQEYREQLADTPALLWHRWAHASHEYKLLGGGTSPQLKRGLNALHVAFLGVGMMLGGAVFFTSGHAAAHLAGPAIIVSFGVAGAAALLSALCYCEFAVRLPRAGATHAYLLATFGELAAWLCAAALLLQYITANAAIARALAPYVGELFAQPPGFGTFEWGGYTVDFLAAGLLCFVSLLLVLSSVSSAWFNLVVSASQVMVLVGMVVAGFLRSTPQNLTDNFMPFGVRGIFDGAAYVFMAFVGFQVVPSMAEEVKKPKRDLVGGVVVSVVAVTLLYAAMAAMLVAMMPYNEVDVPAAFAAAFTYVSYSWGSYLVSLAAILGIISGTLAGSMGAARVVAGVATQHMLPPFLGAVSSRLRTPAVATLATLLVTLPVAVLADVSALVPLVAAGNLGAFGVVALALMWSRYHTPGGGAALNALPAALLAALVGTAAAFALIYQLSSSYIALGAVGGAHCLITGLLWAACRQVPPPPEYSTPLFPLVPSTALLVNAFLLSALPWMAFAQLGVFLACALAVYALYGVQARQVMERRQASHM